jgi:hypothetical protein
MTEQLSILDPACGSRMMWFDKSHPGVVFGDCRSETLTVTDRTHRTDGVRVLEIRPDQVMDFRKMPFPDGTFRLVAFDPPHLVRAGRVLIFKWNETQVRVREVLALTPERPLFGQVSGRGHMTHWLVFMKGAA